MANLLIPVVLMSAIAVQAGSAQPQPQPRASEPAAAAELPSDYVIGPEDVLGIVFWREADISGDVTVRPDGRITLPVIGEMQAAGLYAPTLEWLNPAPSSLALGGTMFEQVVAQTPPVDAIFFCNDDLAQGALLAALRRGIAVPDRIAIAGFNDLTGSDQMLPPLTTVRTPRAEIGVAASRMLLALMRGEVPPSSVVDLGYELVVRESS